MNGTTLKKIKERNGETISEVLIALLISSLALVMLATMISATQNMVSTSKSKMTEYYEKNEDLENLTSSENKLTVTIEGISSSESVYYDVNDKLGVDIYAYCSAASS